MTIPPDAISIGDPDLMRVPRCWPCAGFYEFRRMPAEYGIDEWWQAVIPEGFLVLTKEWRMRTFRGEYMGRERDWGTRLYTLGRYKSPFKAALEIARVWEQHQVNPGRH